MNREDAILLARHAGVLTRWAEAQKDTRPRMFAEVDLDGVQRRGLSVGEMAALAARHRDAAVAILRREAVGAAMGAWASEIGALGDGLSAIRSVLSAYRVGAEHLGFDPRERSR